MVRGRLQSQPNERKRNDRLPSLNSSAITGVQFADYLPITEPFQFYACTQNPQHTRPASIAAIGTNGDRANHQYDIQDFATALAAGNLPAVSFLKAAAYQDGMPVIPTLWMSRNSSSTW
jgi:hypothetical protein